MNITYCDNEESSKEMVVSEYAIWAQMILFLFQKLHFPQIQIIITFRNIKTSTFIVCLFFSLFPGNYAYGCTYQVTSKHKRNNKCCIVYTPPSGLKFLFGTVLKNEYFKHENSKNYLAKNKMNQTLQLGEVLLNHLIPCYLNQWM